MSNSDPGAYGVADQLAPDLGVTRWVDASGQPLAAFDLAQTPGRYKLLFCFQHACPGCHSSGFPALKHVVESLGDTDIVSIAVVQTVFEDFEHNTFEAMLEDQRKYALKVPFGHDAGGAANEGSVLMQRFRNGGTPWFILIGPNGVVVFNDFRVAPDRLIEFLQRASKEPVVQAPPGTQTWRDVLKIVRDGNPPPPRRVELSDDQWRARLTPDQYRVTRERGTERAHSSDMCGLFEPGQYHCVCCDTPLFEASTKFGSKSGWPSFTQGVAPNVLAHLADDSHGMRRVEVACNVCDAHLGHVFPDGPPPSGLRYCINGVALTKAPA